MKNISIHQFAPSANEGDGITNGMFYFQKILQELGVTSNIYAQNIQKPLKNRVLDYKSIDTKDKEQILFIHYSIYYDFSLYIDKLELRKHIIFHNITPPEFFKNDPFLQNECQKGIDLLPSLATKFEGSIGDSPLNSKQLQENNFKDVYTIPLLIDAQKIINEEFNTKLYDEKVEEFSIIFVGRLAQNKAQKDLIEIANIYKDMCEDFKLYIIGSTTDKSYENELRDLIKSHGLQNNVKLTAKVSNADLYAYYRSADVFLCMSEHEGFGIPLIESMLFDIPVIAYDSSNIKSTLNGGGILFSEKSFTHIAATIQLLRQNKAFKREIIATQKKAIKIYKHENIVKQVLDYLKFFSIELKHQEEETKELIKYQFEGPFDSSYSLAILNRESALAFNKNFPKQVALYSTEGNGDLSPNKKFLETHQETKQLSQNSKKAQQCEVVFRNLYPPRVTGMKGELNLLNSYGWEESSFPKEYVKNFNSHLDGITVMSSYVKKVLRSNGVNVPIAVVGLGVDHILRVSSKALDLNTKKSFKFLHISSCFPRKGVDTLLKAYTDAFSIKDDVTLVIKTFPNIHNDTQAKIKALQKENKNTPEIILINKDLSEEYVKWLYENCHTLVAPSKGEGFGLPMAEAMLFDMPVITTGFSGQSDFCTNETSWLIDYSFTKAQTHMGLFNSYWAEPDTASLTSLLKEQVTLTKEQKALKTKKAKELILQEFTWQKYVEKSLSFIEQVKGEKVFKTKTKNIAWVSTYNTKCGIATYSEFLLQGMQNEDYNILKYADYSTDLVDKNKETNVIRCWKNSNDKNVKELLKHILNNKTSHAIINYNFGFFSMKNLEFLLQELKRNSIKTSIIFHSVQDVTIKGSEASLSSISKTLKDVEHILVHNISDLNILKNFSLVNNVSLFPHGVQKREPNKAKKSEKFTIASYGFLLPHKGILELLEAFNELLIKNKSIHLLLVNALYPNPISNNYQKECNKLISKHKLQNNVTMINDFLNDDESFKYLDKADVVVMPYKQTQESSSAAVRYAISTMQPVVCTPLNIFRDVSDIVHFTKDTTPKAITQKLQELLNNEKILNEKKDIQQKWIDEHQWSQVAKRLSIICLDT